MRSTVTNEGDLKGEALPPAGRGGQGSELQLAPSNPQVVARAGHRGFFHSLWGSFEVLDSIGKEYTTSLEKTPGSVIQAGEKPSPPTATLEEAKLLSVNWNRNFIKPQKE